MIFGTVQNLLKMAEVLNEERFIHKWIIIYCIDAVLQMNEINEN